MTNRRRLRHLTLSEYETLTRTKLDLLALLTLWLVVLPFGAYSTTDREYQLLWAARLALSVIFGIDYALRLHKAKGRWRFAKGHILDALAVPLPPLRVIFSLRLLRLLFRRGNFRLFILIACILLLNGAVLVYFFERTDSASSINSLSDALWWAVVTATTIGYGDTVPITPQGRFVAVGMMLLGIVILAMVTARVSSGFAAAAAEDPDGSGPGTPPTDPHQLVARLDRIERLLESLSTDANQETDQE